MAAPIDDAVTAYKAADRRLRELLFGDGIDSVGVVKGDERRDYAAQALRRMREAFDAALESAEEGRAAAARVADLEDELLKRASTRAARARRPRKSAS